MPPCVGTLISSSYRSCNGSLRYRHARFDNLRNERQAISLITTFPKDVTAADSTRRVEPRGMLDAVLDNDEVDRMLGTLG